MKKTKRKSEIYEPEWHEFMSYLSSPFKVFVLNLLAGIARGLGFVFGATVLVAVILFVVGKILVEIPVIGHLFQWLNDFLQQSLEQQNLTHLSE